MKKIPAELGRRAWLKTTFALVCPVIFLLLMAPARAADQQKLHSHVHAAVAKLTPLARLPATSRLTLVIGLPMRNQVEFNNLLQQLYDPASTNFHQYLTPEQFTARFGPTEADYRVIIDFATTNGLQVMQTYKDRKMVDVSAAVSDIEKTFHVTLHTYQHPAENRQFFGPDGEASVDASLPILSVSGLDNYVLPHPMAHKMNITRASEPSAGSGPSGSFFGWDFRNAYAPGVSLTGSGQYVGLVEFQGYYPSDITAYENAASPPLPHVPLVNVYSDGLSGIPGAGGDLSECSLDIEMPIAMAPGLAGVYVFEGNNSDHILGNMVAYGGIKQFSSSWGMSDDATGEQYLQQMGAQGQTFFQASGDGDAYVVAPIYWPADDPYVTSVGGTELSMNSSGASYASESVWNTGFDSNGPWCCNGQSSSTAYWGSGGGYSSIYSIPAWQQSVNMAAVGGSSTKRNLPDVALTADNVWVYLNNGSTGNYMGTSIAAPLWAGFAALVNQQAANQGLPSVGFINPALYSIAQTTAYNSAFHDTTTGNNTWPGSPSRYYTATGYDLCTGWGSPKGQGMIDALVGYAGPVWVNFYAACPGAGNYVSPYCTLALGTAVVSPGGTVCIAGTSSTTVTPTISKPMTLRAFFGPVTIGH
jgi:subtilase family serine protease